MFQPLAGENAGPGTLTLIWGWSLNLNLTSLFFSICRVADVRRNLVSMHKEKLDTDVGLAAANAARADLGSQLAMAKREIAALDAKCAAMEAGGPSASPW